MYNLSIFLEDSARRYPGRDALVLGDVRLTYAQVDAMANQVANLLVDLGVGRGDRVALTCPNLPYFPVIYYGILEAGGVVVPLNVLNKGREVAYYLDDSDAKVYFCFQGTPELPMGEEGYAGVQHASGSPEFIVVTADPAAPSPIEGTRTLGEALRDRSPVFEAVLGDETDTAVILYTSGTTGQPKGAELSHSNLVLNATVNPDFGQVEADPSELNLSAFETFFDEKRPFFVEGKGLFTFTVNCVVVVDCNTGEGLFYSRRIGRYPQLGEPNGEVPSVISTPIIGAAKMTGRLPSGFSLGVLDAVTDRVEGGGRLSHDRTLSKLVEEEH